MKTIKIAIFIWLELALAAVDYEGKVYAWKMVAILYLVEPG
jgi:hypothetical protein